MLLLYLRVLETGMVHERRMSRRERPHAVPTELFACCRHLSGHTLTVACRLLLAGWSLRYSEVWSNNWDEANAI